MTYKLGRIHACVFSILIAAAVSTLLVINAVRRASESTAVRLFGIDIELETIYRTNTSGRGRQSGAYFAVWRLPEDFDAHKINLMNFPKSFSDYERIRWDPKFPSNDRERLLLEVFAVDPQDELRHPSLYKIVDDLEARQLATHLITADQETLCGGWFKMGPYGPVDMSIYILNVKKRLLVECSLDT